MMKIKINILLFTSILIILSGCDRKIELEDTHKKEYPAFVSKCVFNNETDQWFNYFCLELPKLDTKKKSGINNYKFDDNAVYVFDGINLKYKQLDNYYIPIYDKNNMEIGKTDAAFPSLSVSTFYREEVQAINNFFNEKQFSKEISLNDLAGLEISKIEKEILIDMFNRAYHKEPAELGDYLGLPFVAILSSISTNGYIFQVGYYVEYGNIIKVNIEVIYDNGTYLSDLVSNKNLDAEQEAFSNKLSRLEKFILLNQDFDISKADEYDESLKILLNLMKRIIDLNE